VKHAQVRNEAEYHVVRAALADDALSSELPADERETLKAVQIAYENKRPNPSLERTSTGKALGPRSRSAHRRPRGPSALPVASAQLKR
jgi:hypothetical protein